MPKKVGAGCGRARTPPVGGHFVPQSPKPTRQGHPHVGFSDGLKVGLRVGSRGSKVVSTADRHQGQSATLARTQQGAIQGSGWAGATHKTERKLNCSPTPGE